MMIDRDKALTLLDEATELNTLLTAAAEDEQEAKMADFVEKANELFSVLEDAAEDFSEDDVEKAQEEIRSFMTEGKVPDRENSLDATFAVYVIREGLKTRQLPLIKSDGWKGFSKAFSSIVMGA